MASSTDDGHVETEQAGLLEELARAAVLAEAEDILAGVCFLSVATGGPETDEEIARINALTGAAWAGREDAHTAAIRGGNDYLTIRVQGGGAERLVDELAKLASNLNPGWWRIVRSPHPF